MRRSIRLSWLLAFVALLVLGTVGTRFIPAARGASGLVTTGSAHILTTADGRTLYFFTADKPNMKTSACTGQCATFWPALRVPSGTKLPITVPGVSGKFGVLMRADGTQQCTYAGWPLYTFAKDKDSGDAYGEGIANKWFAVVVSRAK